MKIGCKPGSGRAFRRKQTAAPSEEREEHLE